METERFSNEALPTSDVFRRFVEHSVDGLLVIDGEGIVRFANPAAVALFGGNADQLVGYAIGVPASHESVEITLAAGERVRYVEMRCAEVSWEGRAATLANLTDITGRKLTDTLLEKQAEELRRQARQFQSLVEGAPDAVFVITDLVFAYANPACCRLFGATTPAQLLKQPVMDRIDPSVRDLVISRMHTVFDEKAPAPRMEQIWLRMDGTPFPVEVTTVPITYLGKDGAMAFARDITERRKAEDERRRSRKLAIAAAEATAASKAKSLFLSTMSHEIRTPMNAIMGYSQLMLRDPGLGSEALENLKIIKRSGEHLLNILNNILDMAKIEAGRLEITPKTFNLRGHVNDLNALFRLPAQGKDLQLEVSLTGEPVDYIIADEGKIRQVLINLLGNAVKFTERGKIALRVSLERPAAGDSRTPDNKAGERSDDGLWLAAEVEDTGIGMTAAELSRLFQPFVQGEGGKHTQRGGTGLGLAISREVAKALGGDITVRSTPGVGSVFHFGIPVKRAAGAEFRGQSGRRGRIVGIRSEGDAPRVLIADDMPDNREWLTRLLIALGFSVRSVENGEAAVRVWEEWNPQLVLMDVHMPVMDGLEATRRIRASATENKTVIIALTADATGEQRTSALESGMDTFISKPCVEDVLLEKIFSHVPGITYTYEDGPLNADGNTAAPSPGEPPAEQAMEVPADLIPQMREAIADGDKALLDSLILATEERGHAASARALRRQADLYNYERLTELLEKACPS